MCTLPEKSNGCSLKSQIFAFSKIRKSMKNHEISEIAISRLSHFPTFLLSASFFPRRPSRESGRRPLDSENSWRNQRGGPLKSEILAIFQIRKNTKNPEISEIATSRLSHFPTFLLSASFFPRRPSRESERRPPDPKWSTVMSCSFIFQSTYRLKKCDFRASLSLSEVSYNSKKVIYFGYTSSFHSVWIP